MEAPRLHPEHLLSGHPVTDDIAIAFRVLCNSAKTEKARVQCLEVEVARLSQHLAKAEADKRMLLEKAALLQETLGKKDEEHAEQAELWKQEKSRLQCKLNQRGFELLVKQHAETEIKRQLEEAVNRSKQAEAAASVMRSKHEKLGQLLASLGMSMTSTPGGARVTQRTTGSSTSTFIKPVSTNSTQTSTPVSRNAQGLQTTAPNWPRQITPERETLGTRSRSATELSTNGRSCAASLASALFAKTAAIGMINRALSSEGGSGPLLTPSDSLHLPVSSGSANRHVRVTSGAAAAAAAASAPPTREHSEADAVCTPLAPRPPQQGRVSMQSDYSGSHMSRLGYNNKALAAALRTSAQNAAVPDDLSATSRQQQTSGKTGNGADDGHNGNAKAPSAAASDSSPAVQEARNRLKVLLQMHEEYVQLQHEHQEEAQQQKQRRNAKTPTTPRTPQSAKQSAKDALASTAPPTAANGSGTSSARRLSCTTPTSPGRWVPACSKNPALVPSNSASRVVGSINTQRSRRCSSPSRRRLSDAASALVSPRAPMSPRGRNSRTPTTPTARAVRHHHTGGGGGGGGGSSAGNSTRSSGARPARR